MLKTFRSRGPTGIRQIGPPAATPLLRSEKLTSLTERGSYEAATHVTLLPAGVLPRRVGLVR
jgi:hypothetical protein